MVDYFLVIHFSCCLFMTGVIWLVQILHYPSFKFVSEKEFVTFEQFHIKRISYVVVPVMLVEITTAIIAYLNHPSLLLLLNMIFNSLILLFTYALSVPYHNKLKEGKSLKTIKMLAYTNWPRTIFWSLRSLLLIYLIWV